MRAHKKTYYAYHVHKPTCHEEDGVCIPRSSLSDLVLRDDEVLP